MPLDTEHASICRIVYASICIKKNQLNNNDNNDSVTRVTKTKFFFILFCNKKKKKKNAKCDRYFAFSMQQNNKIETTITITKLTSNKWPCSNDHFCKSLLHNFIVIFIVVALLLVRKLKTKTKKTNPLR